ncbi:hypothetical protein [Rhodococcoides corynebacterioides]|uniref:hypothetical protein n=1 Tax=Rhodococcoides corynebacterioides TaxID=53972 RepID=UPI003ADBB1FA
MSESTTPDASGYGEAMGPPDFGTPHTGSQETPDESSGEPSDEPEGIPGYSVPPAETDDAG